MIKISYDLFKIILNLWLIYFIIEQVVFKLK